jgi:hypothetical protein
MDDQALFNQVFICALETVGFTQFLKQLLKGFNIKKPHANIWAAVMVVLAVAFTLGFDFLPQWITGAILVIVVSQLFYDLVFQTLQHIVSNIASKTEPLPPRLTAPATPGIERARLEARAAAVPLE